MRLNLIMNVLDFIENRLNEINQLKRKYGEQLKKLLNMVQQLKKKLKHLQNRETHIDQVGEEIKFNKDRFNY